MYAYMQIPSILIVHELETTSVEMTCHTYTLPDVFPGTRVLHTYQEKLHLPTPVLRGAEAKAQAVATLLQTW